MKFDFSKIAEKSGKMWNSLLTFLKGINKKTWIIIGVVAVVIIAAVVSLCIFFANRNDITKVKINGKTFEEVMSMTDDELNSYLAELESSEEGQKFVASQAEPVVENLNEDPVKKQEDITTQITTGTEFPIMTENKIFKIHSMQKYSGYFIEDGSNIATEDALAMVVENVSGTDIYYARIEMDSDKTEENAVFEMSFIPAGSKVFVQERNNRKYNADEKFTLASCGANEMDYTKFTEHFETMIDTGYVRRPESNCIIIYNKTKKALSGQVFYKQKKDDMLYGGKTFATTLPSPIQPDNSMYISVYHYNQNSVVVAAKLTQEDAE